MTWDFKSLFFEESEGSTKEMFICFFEDDYEKSVGPKGNGK